MTCEEARESLMLLSYGELTFDQEETLELHLAECPSCAAERLRMERLEEMLALGEAEPPPGLLARCRRDLAVKIEDENRPMRRFSPRRLWRDWFVYTPLWLRPVGAMLMLAIGFVGAQFVPAGSLAGLGGGAAAEPVMSRVRFVSPDESGRVRVVMEETRQREFTGYMNDHRIRQALLAAASDPADPGLRVESMELLKNQGQQDDVKQALLNALRADVNSGVRLKALEGLKPYSREPEVRTVLAQVLLNDDNPGVRTQAIDLLIQSNEPEVAGILQQLLEREDNSYVRTRSQRALAEMKASVGTF
ncbi:MAG: HEAT repeat domain-containing protein [Bryobacteraceae bacterium]|nr:HEAT repeat domain-containing protein [Bryobacteraceae bacterium]